MIAYDNQDVVTSEWLVKGADGRECKPEDYLTAFARFVRENPAHIKAIRILLHRPKDWSTGALSELRQKLAASPKHFDIGNLQKAHEIHYKKALVDIISMIKHAAKDGEPLLTAEERVERAFAKVVAGETFTPDQAQWLGLIKAHLIQNLTIDREDFETLPIFTLRGGLSQATRVFAGQLDSLFDQLNEAVAA